MIWYGSAIICPLYMSDRGFPKINKYGKSLRNKIENKIWIVDFWGFKT